MSVRMHPTDAPTRGVASRARSGLRWQRRVTFPPRAGMILPGGTRCRLPRSVVSAAIRLGGRFRVASGGPRGTGAGGTGRGFQPAMVLAQGASLARGCRGRGVEDHDLSDVLRLSERASDITTASSKQRRVGGVAEGPSHRRSAAYQALVGSAAIRQVGRYRVSSGVPAAPGAAGRAGASSRRWSGHRRGPARCR